MTAITAIVAGGNNLSGMAVAAMGVIIGEMTVLAIAG